VDILTIVMLVILLIGFACLFISSSPGQTGFNIAVFVVLLLMLLVRVIP